MTNTANSELITREAQQHGFDVKEKIDGSYHSITVYRRENGIVTHELIVRFNTRGAVIEASHIGGRGKLGQVLAYLYENAAVSADDEPVDTGACVECGSVHGHAEFCSKVVEPDVSTDDGADYVSASNPAELSGDAIFDALEAAYVEIDGFGTRDEYVSPRAPRAVPAVQHDRRDELTVQLDDALSPLVRCASMRDSHRGPHERHASCKYPHPALLSRTAVTGEPNPVPDFDAIEVDAIGPADAPLFEIGAFDAGEGEIVHAMMLRSRRQAERLLVELTAALARGR